MAKRLLVDDYLDASKVLAMYFQRLGHEPTCVASSREALSMVISNPPDVILLDLVMPDMDGPSFLDAVRAHPSTRTLPVVVLTGLGNSPKVDRIRPLVSSVLVKSKSTPGEILRTLEAAVSRAAECLRPASIELN
jgi:CheY-like chemotaxis protein